MQIEHVKNVATVRGTNYRETEKIGMKNQKKSPKSNEKNVLRKWKQCDKYKKKQPYICTHWYKIHQCFLQEITSAIQTLAQRP